MIPTESWNEPMKDLSTAGDTYIAEARAPNGTPETLNG